MAHLYVQITVTDPDIFAQYAAAAGPALAKYGATPVAMTTAPERLEGDAPPPSRAVVLAFPDTEAVQGWLHDPDLAEVHALRRASGRSEMTLLA